MQKAMAPTPALLPGKSHGWRSLVGCQSMGLHRVRHDWSDLAAAAAAAVFWNWVKGVVSEAQLKRTGGPSQCNKGNKSSSGNF